MQPRKGKMLEEFLGGSRHAKWHLYEYDERHDGLAEVGYSDRGNLATYLVHATLL